MSIKKLHLKPPFKIWSNLNFFQPHRKRKDHPQVSGICQSRLIKSSKELNVESLHLAIQSVPTFCNQLLQMTFRKLFLSIQWYRISPAQSVSSLSRDLGSSYYTFGKVYRSLFPISTRAPDWRGWSLVHGRQGELARPFSCNGRRAGSCRIPFNMRKRSKEQFGLRGATLS